MIAALDQPSKKTKATAPAPAPKVPPPPWVIMSCRTCYWRSGAGRCHRYPPMTRLPYDNVSTFPACPQDGWCGEWRTAQ